MDEDFYSTGWFPETWYCQIPKEKQKKHIDVYGPFMDRFARAASIVINNRLRIIATAHRHEEFEMIYSAAMPRLILHVSWTAYKQGFHWSHPLRAELVRKYGQQYCDFMVHDLVAYYTGEVLYLLESEGQS